LGAWAWAARTPAATRVSDCFIVVMLCAGVSEDECAVRKVMDARCAEEERDCLQFVRVKWARLPYGSNKQDDSSSTSASYATTHVLVAGNSHVALLQVNTELYSV